MKKIILSESQSKALASLVEGEVQQMPVDKKMNKPYYINPDKVLVVKKFLDKGYTARDFEDVGPDGFPRIRKIVIMNASNGQPLKPMYTSQLLDLLIDKFQNMFSDKVEREMFLKQVLKDWLNGSIGVHGNLSTNLLKETIVTSDMVDERASETNLEPTEKQKEAGNYKMGHISIKGMPISIENPRGSFRKGKDKDGVEWEIEMKNHYGYFTNTTGNGKDGDAVDVFIGPHPDDFDRVYVIDQKVDGEFDESKVMIGFHSKEEAREAYLSNYSEDWTGLWKITEVPLRVFKKWLYREHKQRKPFADYVTIKKHRLNENFMKEEEHNEIKLVGKMYDHEDANKVVKLLNDKGIQAYCKANCVYVTLEHDTMSPWAADELYDAAKRAVDEYMEEHSYFEEPSYVGAIAEELEPIGMLNNVIDNPDPAFDKKEEPAYGEWKRIRGKKGKMNLKNTETGELLSDKWFDWIGYLIDGVAIVRMDKLGYNLVGEDGELLLPEWHEDILEPHLGKDADGTYTVIDGDKSQKIKI